MIDLTIHINYQARNPDGYQFSVSAWGVTHKLRSLNPCLDASTAGSAVSLYYAIDDLKKRLNSQSRHLSGKPFKFVVAGFHTHGEPCATVKRHIKSTLEEYADEQQ